MTTTTRRVIAIAAVAVAATVLAACSSSSKTSASTSAGSTSGAPILIGSFAPISSPAVSLPEVKAAMEAAVADVNAAGGIKGRPLKLSFCDSVFDPNKELACTRTLIEQKVSALVDPTVAADLSGREYQAAAAAKVPMVGTQGFSPAELNSPVAFPLSSGVPGWVYGSLDHLVSTGSKKIGILIDNAPTGQFAVQMSAAALKGAGRALSATIQGDPASDPTFATAAGKVVSAGVDGLFLAPSPLNVPKMVVALRQAGFTGKISSATELFPDPTIKALGSAADGVMLTSQIAFPSDTSNAGVAAFDASMQKNAPTATRNEEALQAWSAVKLFAAVAKTATSLDAAGILAAFTSLSTPVDLGITPPYSVSGKTSPLPTFSRVVNSTVQNGTVVNGVATADGKGFVDPFAALSQAK